MKRGYRHHPISSPDCPPTAAMAAQDRQVLAFLPGTAKVQGRLDSGSNVTQKASLFSSPGMRIPSKTRSNLAYYPVILLLLVHLDFLLVKAWVVPVKSRQSFQIRSLSTVLAVRRPLRKPIRRTSSEAEQTIQENAAEAEKRLQEALQDPTLLSNTTFHDPLLGLDPSTLRAVTETLGLQRLTEIQAQTFPVAVAGHSLVGRARTGTGKTLAFLIPAIQRLLRADPTVFRPGRTLGLLIVAPTRELAVQIADEAKALLKFQRREIWGVQCCFGGTKINRDRVALSQRIPSVMVATPGRLLDLVEQKTRCVGKRPFADVLGESPIVVLDEGDRLLEAFHQEIRKLLSYMPRTDKRQTMLFSATFPKRLLSGHEGSNFLPQNFTIIDCIDTAVGKNDDAVHAQKSLRIEETYVQLADMKNYFCGLVSLLQETVSDTVNNHSKMLIFFPTTKLVKFVAEMLALCDVVDKNTKVLQIHSRMSQSARTRASSQFRETNRAILLTSDVSARGVDYRDVSLVIQYGAPYNKELYLHRQGRTGRAGSQGTSLIVLLPFENAFKSYLQRSKKIPECSSTMAGINVSDPEIERKIDILKQRVESGHPILRRSAEAAYKSFVAHYLEYSAKGVSGQTLADAACGLCVAMGLNPDDMNELENECN